MAQNPSKYFIQNQPYDVIIDGGYPSRNEEFHIPWKIIYTGSRFQGIEAHEFQNKHGEADQSLIYFLKIFLIDYSNQTFYIVADDVDILLSSVLVDTSAQIYFHSLVEKRAEGGIYDTTNLRKKIQDDNRLSEIRKPIDSIIFLIISLGNDYTGSIYGLTYELILNTFLSNPINLIQDSPQFNPYLDFLKVVYYQKNKSKLRSSISMFSTK